MAENQLVVSDLGFFNINRKIVDSRKYDSEQILTIGNVVSDGENISDFDEESYLLKPNLTFTDFPIVITLSGSYTPSDTEQVAWFLTGDYPETSNVILQFNNNAITLVKNSTELISFRFLNMIDTTPFKAIAEINYNSCRLIVKLGSSIYDKIIPLEFPLNLENFTKLYIGNDPTDLTEFWQGSLNLSEFTVTEQSNILYTPSTGFPFTFSKVLVSDGELGNLTDSTLPVVNHIYEFGIDEISRSGSNILLTSQIDDDSKLTIKEIGLYINTDEGEVLLGNIKNLNINKGDGVPYDLVFTVNISLSFVNVVGFPDENSFILETFTPELYKNFKTVQDVTAYVITNLERLVELNATNIGYNRSQVFYQLQKELERAQDGFTNMQSFTKLMHRLKLRESSEFDLENSEIEVRPCPLPDPQHPDDPPIDPPTPSTIEITADGVASGFSIPENPDWNQYASYVLGIASVTPENRYWELNSSFTLFEDVPEGTSQTFADYGGYYPDIVDEQTGEIITKTQPVVLGINNIDGKNYLFARVTDIAVNEDEEISSVNYVINEDRLLEINLNEKYYIRVEWNNRDNFCVISYSKEGEIFLELTKRVKNLPTEISGNLYIGTEIRYIENPDTSSPNKVLEPPTYLNVFSSGKVDLKDWSVETNEFYWSPLTNITLNNKELIQYYRIPDLYKFAYTVKDVCNEKYNIEVTDTAITGNEDLIDFAYRQGLTLCIKLNLVDSDPRILLAKRKNPTTGYKRVAFIVEVSQENRTFTINGDFSDIVVGSSIKTKYNSYGIIIKETFYTVSNVTYDANAGRTTIEVEENISDENIQGTGELFISYIEEPYFVLTYINKKISFTLYNEENNSITLSRKLEPNELAAYEGSPILLTIKLTGDKNLYMYRNNDLIASFEGVSKDFKQAYQYNLTNYVSDELLEELCANEDKGDLTPEQYIEYVKSNQGRYVENIIVIKGAIDEDELYYINNLMDTNY